MYETRSIPKAATPEEFPQQRSSGNFRIGNGHEEFQEAQQSMCLGVFGASLGNLPQDGLGVASENGKFKQQGRIEHGIGVLLVREYPFFFSIPHTIPTGNGILSRIASVAEIPDDAAQQSIVGGGYPVVIIQGDRRQG